MDNLVGRTINNLLVLEQKKFPRPDGRGSRHGATVRCQTCGREFNCRCDNLVKGTIRCLPCAEGPLGTETSGTVPA